MTWSVNHHTKAQGTNGATSPDIDTTGDNFLFATVAFNGASEPTFSDSKGNTWHQLATYRGIGNDAVTSFWCVPTTVGSGHNFTFSLASSIGSFVVIGASGGHASAPFNHESGQFDNSTSSTSIATGSITPDEANELILTGASFYSDPASNDLGGTDVDQTAGAGSFYDAAMAYEVQTAATSRNVTWTTPGSAIRAVHISCFKSAAAASPFPFPGRSHQRYDLLPDHSAFVHQQRRPAPLPIPAPPSTRPLPYQRYDELPVFDAHWWSLPRPHLTFNRIYLVQSTSSSFASSSSARTLAFTSNVTIGDALFVAAWTDSATGGRTVAITDSLGNTWTKVDDYRNANVGDNRFRLSVWYAVANASGACTITCTPSGTVALALGLLEYAGENTPVVIDGAVGQDGASSTSWSTTQIPVNTPHEMAIGFFGCETDKSGSFSPTGGFVTDINLSISSTSDSLHVIEHPEVSAGLAATATVSIARGYAAIGVSLFAQAPPSPPPTRAPSQRMDPLPVYDYLWWQQLRPPPVPLSRPPDNPNPQPLYQRFDPLPVLDTWWEQFRKWPKPVEGPPPVVDSPKPQLNQQRFDPLPVFTYVWWEYVEFLRKFAIPSPVTPPRPSHVKPFLNRVPSNDPRLRRFSELLSELVNSLMGGGYIQETETATWKIISGGGTKAGAPGATDDASTGFNVGSVLVDTSASDVYVCTSSTIGAAVWKKVN